MISIRKKNVRKLFTKKINGRNKQIWPIIKKKSNVEFNEYTSIINKYEIKIKKIIWINIYTLAFIFTIKKLFQNK